MDQASLKGALDEILADFRSKHKRMEIAVINQPITVRGREIVFFLSGELQKDIFLKLKPELTGLFRKSLKHTEVDITYELKEDHQEQSNKLYTSTDKLNFLKRKSPALQELQKRFGLETDF